MKKMRTGTIESFWLDHVDAVGTALGHLTEVRRDGRDRWEESARLVREIGRLAAHGLGIRCEQRNTHTMGSIEETILEVEIATIQDAERVDQRVDVVWRRQAFRDGKSSCHAQFRTVGKIDVMPVWRDATGYEPRVGEALESAIAAAREAGLPPPLDRILQERPGPWREQIAARTGSDLRGSENKGGSLQELNAQANKCQSLSSPENGFGVLARTGSLKAMEACAATLGTALDAARRWETHGCRDGLCGLATVVGNAGGDLRLTYAGHGTRVLAIEIGCETRAAHRLREVPEDEEVLISNAETTTASVGVANRTGALGDEYTGQGRAVMAMLDEQRAPGKYGEKVSAMLKRIAEHPEVITYDAADAASDREDGTWSDLINDHIRGN